METSEIHNVREVPLLNQSLSHSVREQLLLLDAALSVQAASKSFYAAFRLTAAETIGKQLSEVGDGQWNFPGLLTRLNEMTKLNAETNDFEMEHAFPALGPRSMQLSARRLTGDDAQHGMILLSVREGTGQKWMEPEINELVSRFRTTLASIGDAVIVTDPESRITFMNPAAEKLTGWAHRDAMQRHLPDVFNIVNEESSLPVENPVARAIREGTVVGLPEHKVLIARNGSEWPIDDSAAPIMDSGRVVGVVLVFRDVTNRRKSEQDLQISEVRYRRLFEAAHDGILILDAVTAEVLDVNPFLANLLGYCPSSSGP
jgi:PAS domain S-box-containing protein